MENTRCRIYARVSSDRQKTDNTISNQISPSVHRDVSRAGLELTGVYTDDGKSASSGKLHLRGDFQRMLADASTREFDVLWVADLDRVTRSNDWAELGLIFGPLQKAGVKIAGPNMAPMELGNTMSMLQMTMRIAIAYEDNQKRMERFTIGKRQAALRGCHVQGPTPYGLTWRTGARDASGWGTDERKASIVRDMYRLCAGGMSSHQIAKELEDAGTPGPQVNEKNPKGGRWFEAAIRILRSSVYRGVYRWNDVTIPVPRIVEDDVWYMAQAALGKSKTRNLGKPIAIYFGHQLATCALCGSPMHARLMGRGGVYTRKYVCRRATHRRLAGESRCSLPSFDQVMVDREVWNTITTYLAQPDAQILADLRGSAAAHVAEVQAWATDIEKYTAQLAEVDGLEKGIMEMIMEGIVTPGNGRQQILDNRAKRSRIETQLRAAQEAVNESTSTLGDALDLSAVVSQLKASVVNASPRQARAVVREMVRPGGFRFDAHGLQLALAFGPGSEVGGNTRGTCGVSMVKNASQVPQENTVMLRVVIGR